MIIYDQGPDKTVMIVNAATKEKDKTWLLSQLDQNQIQLTDVSDEKILIALQGPLPYIVMFSPASCRSSILERPVPSSLTCTS